MLYNLIIHDEHHKKYKKIIKNIYFKSNIDLMLMIGIFILSFYGWIVLYSASNGNIKILIHQLFNFCFSFGILLIFAHISFNNYKSFIPWVFAIGLLLLLIVVGLGSVNRGVQRWLNFGAIQFQPSEIMKLAVPMMLSWYLSNKVSPLKLKDFIIGIIIIIIPSLMIAKQPDLGTAILVIITGSFVLILAGITWRIVSISSFLIIISIPIICNFMHPYQKMRISSFLFPEKDPFGSGYNIIQSKIAIGSGGIIGKGWLHGSQSYLQFLPVRSTDFIFAVLCEEFGFIGCLTLFFIFGYIIGRCLYISAYAQDNFSRLLTGSLALSLFTSFFVNIAMVSGLLPVVGVPLPLISYGGSSLLTSMASFGIIMSIYSHRKKLVIIDNQIYNIRDF